MFRKLIIAGIMSAATLAAAQAPAQAAMNVAKPTGLEQANAGVELVSKRRRFRHRNRFRHRHGFRHWRWRHHGHHYGHGRYWKGKWISYRRCLWLQKRGYRIGCHYYY